MKQNKWIVVGLGFISFMVLGLFDGLRGVAWPSMSEAFGQSLDALGTLFFAGAAGHIVASTLSGRLLSRTTFFAILIGAFALASTGIALPIFIVNWWVLVLGIFVVGIGLGLLDSSMNNFASVKWEPRLINWLHAFYGIGATLGSSLMTAFLVRELNWQVGFSVIVVAYLTLIILFTATRPLWTLKEAEGNEPLAETNLSDTLKIPVVWLCILLFALHTGIEVSAGNWAFTILTESRLIAEGTAGTWSSAYWFSLMLGRILIGFFTVDGKLLLRVAMGGLIVGAGLFVVTAVPFLSFLGLMIMGFSIAPIFPALVAQTPERLGLAHASNGMGLQVGAAGLGAAIIPATAGYLGQGLGLESIPLFIVGLCILFFALHEMVLRTAKIPAPVVSTD